MRPVGTPGEILLALALFAGVAVAGQPVPPDPVSVEALVSGVWHAEVDGEDYLYELTSEGGQFGGRLHRVSDGRQIHEIPVGGVSLRGSAIEIQHRGFPSYEGVADLERGAIEGGVVGAPRFQDMRLVRVEGSEWPMVHPRSAPGSGKPAYVWSRPRQQDDGWLTGAPSEVGIDLAAVEGTVRAILEGEAGALHSFLVLRDGRLVVEEYFHGWSADDVHHAASVTKSMTSLLIGIAIDRQELSGVDVPLIDFFPELVEEAGDGWEAVRLEHLLTMSMGLDWTAREATGWPPLENQYSLALSHDVKGTPGSHFRYVNRNVNLLSRVLLRATGVEADLFAGEHLFSPLGIETWDWENRRWEGHPDLAAALKIRPRDMAKLGQLVLNEGAWQGKQVISAEWIRESTRTHISSPSLDYSYGYLWWRMDPPPPEMTLGKVTLAVGMGSQYVLVMPDVRLVVVTTGGNEFNGAQQLHILQLIARHLVPGVSQRP